MRNSKKTRATALPNPELVDQLCDAVMSRLEKRLDSNCLLSSRFRVRVPAGTPPNILAYQPLDLLQREYISLTLN